MTLDGLKPFKDGETIPNIEGVGTYISIPYGHTLRDWFAGQAMELASKLEHDKPTGSEGQPTYTGIATRAYYMADAMLCARKQG